MKLVRHVLLVGLSDDEAARICIYFEDDHGCSVELISRCLDATERIRKATENNPVHIIITEAQMAPMNGIALALQFRERGWTVPIILISNGTNSEHILSSASPYFILRDAQGMINIVELMKMVHGILYHHIQNE